MFDKDKFLTTDLSAGKFPHRVGSPHSRRSNAKTARDAVRLTLNLDNSCKNLTQRTKTLLDKTVVQPQSVIFKPKPRPLVAATSESQAEPEQSNKDIVDTRTAIRSHNVYRRLMSTKEGIERGRSKYAQKPCRSVR